MTDSQVLLALTTFCLLQACSPGVRISLSSDPSHELNPNEKIYVVHNYDDLPAGANYLGRLKTKDSGLSITSCGYDEIIADAKEEARKKGANIIALTKIKQPNLWTGCYRVKANLYYNKTPSFVARLENNLALANQSTLPAEADYAVVHFYRPKYYPGSVIGYDIKDDNGKVLGRIKNGTVFQYKTTEFGETTFFAKNDKEQVTLDLQPGQEYYLRCSVAAGFPVAQPDMYPVDNSFGNRELSEM